MKFHGDTRAFFDHAKVFVAGGSGFIGSHVVEQLIELGAKVTVLSRSPQPRFLEAVMGQIQLVNGDLTTTAQLSELLQGHDVCLNLAATVAGIERNSKEPATIFQQNLGPFMNLMSAVRLAGIRRVLVTSSACVYPRECSIPTPEEEGFLDQPDPSNRGYGWAKRMEEFLGEAYAQEFGLEVAIARPYNAYGPRDNFEPKSSHVIPALIRKAATSVDGSFEVWGNGDHSRSFLYVEDFARGLLEVTARHAVAKALNLGNNEEVKVRDLALQIATLVGARQNRTLTPRFVSDGLTGQPRRRCDTQKAESLLGFSPQVRLENGLERTVDWFFQEHAS